MSGSYNGLCVHCEIGVMISIKLPDTLPPS